MEFWLKTPKGRPKDLNPQLFQEAEECLQPYHQKGKPDVTIEFDVDRPSAVRSRRQAFAEAVAEGYIVAGAHIAFPGIGNVLAVDNHFGWMRVNYYDGKGGVVK